MKKTNELVCMNCHKNFWEGFDAAIEMVMQGLDQADNKTLFTVHNFINEFRESLIYEVELYKKDG